MECRIRREPIIIVRDIVAARRVVETGVLRTVNFVMLASVGVTGVMSCRSRTRCIVYFATRECRQKIESI